MMNIHEKIILGRNEEVDIVNHATGVPAKVDTGADSSSIWVSEVSVNRDGVLSFTLFGEVSPYYTGERIECVAYKVAVVRSASGHEQLRYRVPFTVRVGGKRIKATFNLSDRAKNKFPILIGRRTLKERFLVDVSKARFEDAEKVFMEETAKLNNALEQDPYEFYKQHYEQYGIATRRQS